MRFVSSFLFVVVLVPVFACFLGASLHKTKTKIKKVFELEIPWNKEILSSMRMDVNLYLPSSWDLLTDLHSVWILNQLVMNDLVD